MSVLVTASWWVNRTCPLGIPRHLAQGARLRLGLHPRARRKNRMKEKGSRISMKIGAGQQHPHGEDAPQIRVEGDVAEPERRHHRQGPVDPGEPG